MPDSGFTQWAKDGRLATIALVVVFSAWLCFQIFVDAIDRPGMLDQLLWTVSSGWLVNIALVQGRELNKPDDSKKKDDDNA